MSVDCAFLRAPSYAGHVLERDNVVARLDICHTLTDRLDNTSTLVSKNNGECALWILSGECVCVYRLLAGAWMHAGVPGEPASWNRLGRRLDVLAKIEDGN